MDGRKRLNIKIFSACKAVFLCKDFCGSAVVAMAESEGMNEQIDGQAQQTPHLTCSLAEQRCLEA